MSADEGDKQDEEGADSSDGMTFEEWNRSATAANPLDSYLKKKRKFDETEPPVEAIKLYRQEGTYYLLNRGDQAIRQLRYRAAFCDVNTKNVKKVQSCELSSIPGQSYVEVGTIELAEEMRMRFQLERVEWEGGNIVEESRSLTLYESSDGVPNLGDLDLTRVRETPSVIKTTRP